MCRNKSNYIHGGSENMSSLLVILMVLVGLCLAGFGFYIMYKFYKKI